MAGNFCDSGEKNQGGSRERAIEDRTHRSTAVPGLAAKPIIDILAVVAHSGVEESYLPKLEALYELRVREPAFQEHRMLRTPTRDVHVHVYSQGSPEITKLLTFRDRLRQSPDDRQHYEQTKRRLATKDWTDMDAYADAKSEVIEKILVAAVAPATSDRTFVAES